MAITLINIGTVANDGTGDDLREAFLKVNQNFEELDIRVPESTTASNLGSGTGVFASKVGYDLQFKSIVAGENVTLTTTDNQITVNATGGLQQLIVVSDLGSKILTDGDTLRIQGGANVDVEYDSLNDRFLINSTTQLSTDLSPVLSATLDANSNAITNVGTVSTSNAQLGNNYLKTINGENLNLSAEGGGQVLLSGNDLIVNNNISVGNNLTVSGNLLGDLLGNVEGLVYGADVRRHFSNLDFGETITNITSWMDYLIYSSTLELGSFTAPSGITIDLGEI